MGVYFFGLSLHVSLHVSPYLTFSDDIALQLPEENLQLEQHVRSHPGQWWGWCFHVLKEQKPILSEPRDVTWLSSGNLFAFPGPLAPLQLASAALQGLDSDLVSGEMVQQLRQQIKHDSTNSFQVLLSDFAYAVTIPPTSICVWNRLTAFQGWQGIDERWLFRSLVQLCGVWHFVDLFGEKGPPRTSPKDWGPGWHRFPSICPLRPGGLWGGHWFCNSSSSGWYVFPTLSDWILSGWYVFRTWVPMFTIHQGVMYFQHYLIQHYDTQSRSKWRSPTMHSTMVIGNLPSLWFSFLTTWLTWKPKRKSQRRTRARP